jgi:hypothetical protein
VVKALPPSAVVEEPSELRDPASTCAELLLGTVRHIGHCPMRRGTTILQVENHTAKWRMQMLALYIEEIQCTIASAGVNKTASGVFQAAVTTVMGAMGAVAGAAGGTAVAVGTGGTGIPLTILLPTLMGASASAMGAALSAGAVAGVTAIGHSLPDNLFVKINGARVWPKHSGWYDVKSGQTLKSVWSASTNPAVITWLKQKGQTDIRVNDDFIYSGPAMHPATIELWEHDTVSSDDLLGATVVSMKDVHPVEYFVMVSDDEQSMYVLGVSVASVP